MGMGPLPGEGKFQKILRVGNGKTGGAPKTLPCGGPLERAVT